MHAICNFGCSGMQPQMSHISVHRNQEGTLLVS